MTPTVRLSALAFLVAAAYLPGIYSAASSPRWWVLAVGLPLASDLDPRRLPVVASAFLLLGPAWAAATLTWTPDPYAGALAWYQLALLGLVAVAASGVEVGPVLTAFGWGLAISAALAVPQALGWHPLPATYAPSPLPGFAAPSGLFYSPEVLAVTATPVLVWATLARRWLLAVITSVPLALCGSRAAVLVASVGLLYGWRPERRWPRWAAIVLAVLIAPAVLLISPDKAATGAARIVLWLSALHSVTPLGRGLGWWQVAHPGPYEEFAHSDALQSFVELGSVAGLLLGALVVLLWRTTAALPERAALVAACATAAVSFPIHLPASGFLFALLAGHVAGDWGRVRGAEPACGIGAAPCDRGTARRGARGAADVSARPAPAGAGAGDPA